MRRRVVCAVAAVALVLLAPASALAWTMPDSEVGGSPLVGPFVGVADDGEAIAQWHQTRGVYVSIRPAGGQFARPVRIGGPARLSYMSVGPRGDAVAVWRARRRGNPVYVSIRRPGEPFGRAQLVARRTASFPLAAIDGSGRFGVVWTQGRRSTRRVIRFADGRAGRVVGRRTLSRPGATSPVIDMSDNGNTGVAWIQGTQARRRGRVLARVRPAGGSFRAAEALSPSRQSTGSPRIAIGAGGAGMVAWRTGRPRASSVWARDAEGAAPAQRLSTAGRTAGDPAVGIAADGEATVVWAAGRRDQQGLYNGGIFQSTRAAGEETFGSASRLSDVDRSAYLARMDVNERGDTIVLWTEYDESDSFYQASAYRPNGGAFEPPEQADSTPHDALNGDVGIDAAGNAVSAWVDIDDGIIRAAFRPAGP